MAEEGETSFQDLEAAPWMDPLIEKISELQEMPLKTSIFKVPNKLRKVDEEAYSPRIVSIGPFHKITTTISVLPQTLEHKEDHPETPAKKHDHLLAMEKQKRWYIVYLLNRKGNVSPEAAKQILVDSGKAILALDKIVRGRYAEDIILDPHQLAEIMLVDGCFILELFLRSCLRDFEEQEDPVFYNAWVVPALRHDLALLENQIPFSILETLFDKFVPKNERPASLIDLALSFFHPHLKEATTIREKCRNKCSQGGVPLHLLALLHSLYLPTSPRVVSSNAKESPRFKKCATELLEAGIQFNKMGEARNEEGEQPHSLRAMLLPPPSQNTQTKMKWEEDHLLEISFSDGVITIPPLMRIDETKKSLLRNLIAYEQCCGSASQHITTYAILLQSLIQSQGDVELFLKKEIITNDSSEVEDVLAFFKNISKDILPNDFKNISGGVDPKDFYFVMSDKVEKYLQGWRWHRLWAFLTVRCRRYMVELKSKYCSSPWAIISVAAAGALLALTSVQTIYAVRS